MRVRLISGSALFCLSLTLWLCIGFLFLLIRVCFRDVCSILFFLSSFLFNVQRIAPVSVSVPYEWCKYTSYFFILTLYNNRDFPLYLALVFGSCVFYSITITSTRMDSGVRAANVCRDRMKKKHFLFFLLDFSFTTTFGFFFSFFFFFFSSLIRS